MVDILEIKPQAEKVSYDLGWLLQNAQVSDERLCSFLIEETSTEIERLVFRFLKSPAERVAAVDQILLSVLQQRRSYKSNISGKVWLYRLILKQCLVRVPQRAWFNSKEIEQVLGAIDTRSAGEAHFNPYLDSLTELQRLFAVLQYGHNLSAEEIALVLKMGLEPVRAGLEQARQLLIGHQRACDECATRHSTLQGMETTLRAALQSKQALMETGRESSAELAATLLDRLAREKTSRHTRQWALRGLETGLVVLLLVIGEWVFSHSRPIPTAAPEAGESAGLQIAAELAPPLPEPTATPQATPATVISENNFEEVLALTRASQGRWKSLWADVQVKTYTMESYSDGTSSLPWFSLRKQIWLSLPGSARVISGPLPGSPDITYSISNQRFSGQDFASGQSLESSASDLIPDRDLKKLFSPPDMFAPGGQFIRMGSEAVAGRRAWVLDWRSSGRTIYRYWVDQEYGVVLRRLEFSEGVFHPIASDMLVTRIFFDASFPAAIYEPYRYKGDHFANDFSGNPEIQDIKSALQTWTQTQVAPGSKGSNFVSPLPTNLATTRLTFQNVPAGWRHSTDGPRLELFANQVDLGQVPLGGKSILACERSPDGSRIAYNSPPAQGSGDTMLLVADLGALQKARPALADGITAGDFAFSPDNRRLAFFGCEKSSGFCGLMMLELASGKLTRMAPLNFADYMSWSPDGRSIALVGNDDASGHSAILSTTNLMMSEMMNLLHTWHFQVMDAASGNVTFKTKFDWSNLAAPADSPTHGWGQPFKVPNVGVTGCTNPPG